MRHRGHRRCCLELLILVANRSVVHLARGSLPSSFSSSREHAATHHKTRPAGGQGAEPARSERIPCSGGSLAASAAAGRSSHIEAGLDPHPPPAVSAGATTLIVAP